VDNFVSLQGREIGECIYYGDRDGPLGTEHAVPYGLNGSWTLRRASCAVCAKITSRFEHGAMRHLWPDVRNALAMQSRRRDKRSATLPVVVQRDGLQETIQVPRSKFPRYLATPLFPPPAKFWSDRPVRGVFANLNMMHLCGPSFAEASKEYPGYDSVGMQTTPSSAGKSSLTTPCGKPARSFCLAESALCSDPLKPGVESRKGA
jgi:hypothetical protein